MKQKSSVNNRARITPFLFSRRCVIETIGLLVLFLFPLLNQADLISNDGNAPAKTSEHWVFQPVDQPLLPEIQRTHWPRNPLDYFVLARLEKVNIQPAQEADRATLIRRLSFDLTGLPPNPEDIDRFLNDASENAYENLVDRLLASPQYGERWARHWLDIARYTESQGYEYDHMRPNAWHYRDYVIRSFNNDKPYDEFIKEQIAGDAMVPATPDRIIATSLLVCGPWDQAGNSQANATQRAVTREEELEDLISVVSQSFLGLTVNCARCHDHKFDPIPQNDYYQLKSVFEGVRHGERIIASPITARAREEKINRLKQNIETAQTRLTALNTNARTRYTERQSSSRSSGAIAPEPYALWTFDGSAKDSIGSLDGTLKGGATITSGHLHLDGKNDFLQTEALSKDLTEKTLEVWLSLSNLKQRGGGALSVETENGAIFDAIVFGEREERKWIAGSNNFKRTQNLNGPKEFENPNDLIHIAVVYKKDNTIEVFRNAELYGIPYTTDDSPKRFMAGSSHVLIGKPHSGAGNGFLAADIEQAALYDRALSSEEIDAAFRTPGFSVSIEDMLSAMTDSERIERQKLTVNIAEAQEALKAIPALPVSYAGIRKQPAPTRLLTRGDVKFPADLVTARGLSSIAELAPDLGLDSDSPEADRRLQFAEWIVDPKNPLPARTMANRIWQYHFGKGIVATPNDLGASGTKPTHPNLLDWLATHLMNSNWSVKALHRLIVHSATYRQNSTYNDAAARIDSDNRLLWRFSPRRLEAEALRDAMLFISDRLNLTQAGPSFRPFDTKSFNATFYFPKDKPGPEFDRRTVYRMNVNSGKDPLLEAFDAPDPSIKTPLRGVTTTPLQALGLMNNPFVLRQANHFANRVLQESENDYPNAVQRAYRYATGRSPTPGELDRAVTVAGESEMRLVCWALFNTTEFIYVH